MTTIADLIPDAKNARKRGPRAEGLLVASLHEVGAARSIVIDENNNILAGNGTVQAAAEAGIERVTVVDASGLELVAVRRTGLTEAQKKRLALLDNRTGELAEWDAGILAELAQEGVNLDDLWNPNELEEMLAGINGSAELLTDPDAIPESVETRAKLGDLWRLGEHRLLCGDSTKREDVERLMGGAKADCVFTDPPYGLGDNKSFNNNHPDYEDDAPFDLKLLELGAVEYVIWGANYYDWLPAPRNKIGWIVWDKRPSRDEWTEDTRAAADRRFGQHFEIAITSIPETRGKMLRRTWGGYYGTAGDEANAIVHKTQKPIELVGLCLQPRHKLIVDYFLGSGTTLIAAEQLGRKCYGIEIEPKYCDVIIARWEQATGKTAELVKTGRRPHDPTPRKVLVNATPRPTIKKTNGKTNKVHAGN